MKSDYNKLSDTKAELIIEAAEADLKPLKTQTLKQLQPEVSAPGFRKGKVPLNIVEKEVADNYFKSQVLDNALNELYHQALKQHKLRPLSQPEVEMKKFVPFSEIQFKVTVDVVPPIKVGDYKKIKKKLNPDQPTNDDIEEVLDNLLMRMAEKKPVDRAAETGDQVTIDFKGTNEKDEDVAGASGKDYPIRIGSNTFIEGFEDEVIGLKKDDDKKFSLRFPKDSAHKPLANKKVIFDVKVKLVEEMKAPKLDDKFASQVGPFKSVAELKADIKNQLIKQKEVEAGDKLRDEILEELVNKSKVEAPDTLVEENVENALNEFKHNLVYRGITFPEYLKQAGMTEDEYREQELRPRAEIRVKTGLVLAEVSDLEGIEVSAEELEVRLQLLRGQHSNDAQMMAQLNNPEAVNEIASRMVTEKTVEKLVEYAAA